MMPINYGSVENKAGDQEDNYAGRTNFKRNTHTRTRTRIHDTTEMQYGNKKTGGGWSTQEDEEDSAKPVDGDRSQ